MMMVLPSASQRQQDKSVEVLHHLSDYHDVAIMQRIDRSLAEEAPLPIQQERDDDLANDAWVVDIVVAMMLSNLLVSAGLSTSFACRCLPGHSRNRAAILVSSGAHRLLLIKTPLPPSQTSD